MTSAVAVRSVSKAYGKVKVLQNVTFECQPGTVTALVGPNGAGKSTILRLLCGLSSPTGGQVEINGSRLHDIEPGTVIGSVLDPTAHHPSRSVYSTISIAAKMIGVSRARVDGVIDALGLSTVAKRKFRALSLGMKQRVCLGIALLGEPKILVLDEPMNGLDVEGIEWLRTTMQTYVANGGTVIISSHLLNELQAFADRVIVVSQGRIVADEAVQNSSPDASRVQALNPPELEALLERHSFGFQLRDNWYEVDESRQRLAQIAHLEGVILIGLDDQRSTAISQFYKDRTEGAYKMTTQEGAK
ncbi:ATP-binding cassette domain-containing protein [Clavibacter michiganensis subsp. insidiosus]|uniref:ATP-binding cassette domain-containing protein n=1 Tax=Clavibacter michiganensis subsp. insidiosus TaxID=33014 RepID=A0A399N3C3_9MICO|nr:hypothetical protein B5P21_15060 [Clavibacter michiganensis subsp. insidiosus]RII88592.1 ATP-binding cassette domain-containing protein [Clavibacter michiganensis subsp. insidiosus]RIJ44897.1 ATP-binding cassette domain-containing protein [Clavibacter michiganensis subsp. insidiosus]RMC85774.1 ATP-binding cassette domain-containing protein [Clavibacter michiganensis subsp. insidiosus]